MRAKRSCCLCLTGVFAASILAGCNAILGLDELSIGSALDGSIADAPIGPVADAAPDNYVGECTTNVECTDRATAAALDAGTLPERDGGERVVPAVCMKPEARCVQLLSEDCHEITGDYRDDEAIVLGTLFSTVGAQGAMNLQRQRAATLAAEQINAVGGIPAVTTGGKRRPLVMVSCNEAANLTRVGEHLITQLRVPAIVGPNTSQDTLDLSNSLSVQAGTVLLTPTAVASSIAELMDNDLTWLMVPSDRQRGPLMINQIQQLERELKMARGKQVIRLGIIYRNDAVGLGTFRSLNDLELNGQPLNHPINAGTPTGNVFIDGYEFTATDQTALVNRYLEFKPDILVLAGLAEVIQTVMKPLEERWGTASGERPHYVLTDQVKGPDVIGLATNSVDLRHRVRGTGLRPSKSSEPVGTAFELDYRARYGMTPTASGAGPSFDATYAIAYALATLRDQPITGANIAKGLRKLAGGATTVDVGASSILLAFGRLGAGENIKAIGTYVPFEWDDRGAVVNGTIEVWCVGAPAGTPAYASSGLTYDINAKVFEGMYVPCTQ